jgi:hypothetical protein
MYSVIISTKFNVVDNTKESTVRENIPKTILETEDQPTVVQGMQGYGHVCILTERNTATGKSWQLTVAKAPTNTHPSTNNNVHYIDVVSPGAT